MKKMIAFFCFIASILPIAIGTAFAQDLSRQSGNKYTDSLNTLNLIT